MQRPHPFSMFASLAVFVWFGGAVCHGAAPETGGGLQMESADDLMASWLKMFGALITVLSIFFLGVLIFKKYGSLLQNKASQGQLKVIECRALNQRNAVYVVDYAGERFLVATGQQGSPDVTPLRSATDNDVRKASLSPTRGGQSFSGEMKKAMHGSA